MQAFGGRLQKHDLNRLLFLFRENHPNLTDYDFLPWQQGIFSLQLAADGQRLQRLGLLRPGADDWCLTDCAPDFLTKLPAETRELLTRHALRNNSLRGYALARKIYGQYPYYAINSELATDIMRSSELKKIKLARPARDEPAFFTIGYEGISIDTYLNRLVQNDVRILCDVRKNPLSRKLGFSKTELCSQLKILKIEYVSLPELGIENRKRQLLHSLDDYQKLFADYRQTTLRQNRAAIRKLGDIFARYRRMAITCFEADHRMCHRSQVAAAFAVAATAHVAVINI